MMLAGMLAGGLWGLIPGILRARLGVNEIITTLMLNYIALFWVQFWVFGPWSEGGFQQTKAFPPEAWLPRLTDFAAHVPGPRRPDGPPRAHLRRSSRRRSCGSLLERTRWGYEIRLIGDSPRAARYAGIDIERKIDRGLRRSPARSPASPG